MRLATSREIKYVLQLDPIAINVLADGVWLHWMRIGDKPRDAVSYRAFNFLENEAPSLRGHALVIREHASYWTGHCTRCREWSCTQIAEDAVIQAFAGHLYSPKCAVCHTRKEEKTDMLKLKFFINNRGDSAAGLRAYTDEVTVIVDSGRPGGEDGEFAEELRGFLEEWFDGSRVSLVEQTLNGAPLTPES